MAGGESGKGLYDHLYRRFFEQRDSHDGYSFQEAPGGSAPTPTVTFSQKLRWWTWDRGNGGRRFLPSGTGCSARFSKSRKQEDRSSADAVGVVSQLDVCRHETNSQDRLCCACRRH